MLQAVQPANAQQALGAAISLAAHSRLYFDAYLFTVATRILAGIENKQAVFIADSAQRELVGFATYALLGGEPLLATEHKLRGIGKSEWNCGDTVWLMDYVWPSEEVRAMIIREIKARHPKAASIKMHEADHTYPLHNTLRLDSIS